MWPWPLTDFSGFRTKPSFYHTTLSCQSKSKSVNNFLSYRGNKVGVADRQTDRQKDKQRDKQTDRETHKSEINTSYHFVMEVNISKSVLLNDQITVLILGLYR